MEWVETTAKTVEEAKELALDQLGIDHDEAEFIIVEEPKPGLFRRMRGDARVRARVTPRKPRAKVERRGRRSRSEGQQTSGRSQKSNDARGQKAKASPKQDDGNGKPKKAPTQSKSKPDKPKSKTAKSASGSPSPTGTDNEERTMTVTLDEQVVIAENFLTGLLEAFGLTGTIEQHRPNADTAELNVVGDDLGILIGPRGNTISAIQEITRITLQRESAGSHEGRVHVDVGGYRGQRREALAKFAIGIAEKVVATGKPIALEPMSASDRKAVHDAINDVEGVRTTSEGVDPRRWVKIVPLADAE